MLLRPTDASGDILPVLSPSDLAAGSSAVVGLIRDRLNLLSGEWWENPALGCEALDMLRAGRVSAADFSALVSYLSAYIRETPGVRSVEDAAAAVSGRQFLFSCRVLTEDGSADVSWSLSL